MKMNLVQDERFLIFDAKVEILYNGDIYLSD